MNALDLKSYGGNMDVKFDIGKAFDTMEWYFLLKYLLAFGFSNIMVGWIREILESARLSILVNGTPYGFLPCEKGCSSS